MKKFKYQRLVSVLVIIVILCFTFLGTLQFHNKMGSAVSFQFNLIYSAKSFVKTYLLYPYMSAFVKVSDFVTERAGPGDLEASKRPTPVKNKSRNNTIFQQIYYILSTVLITNKNVLFFLLIAFAGISLGFKKRFNAGYKNNRITVVIRFYTTWILGFISFGEKLLQTLYDRYDIGHVKNIMGKITRALDKIFGARVFLLYKKI